MGSTGKWDGQFMANFMLACYRASGSGNDHKQMVKHGLMRRCSLPGGSPYPKMPQLKQFPGLMHQAKCSLFNSFLHKPLVRKTPVLYKNCVKNLPLGAC